MTRLSAKSERRQRLDGPFPLAAMDNLAQALRRGYRLARQRQLTRRALLDLEAAELKDIGLSAEAGPRGSLAGVLAGRKIRREEGMIRCRNCGERPASEGHICMVCKRRSDIDPYKALIAMALLVYCGVSLAAYLKPHMPAPPPTAGSSVQPAEELAQRARQATLEQRGI